MKCMKRIFIISIVLTFFIGCKKVDYNNPESVLENFLSSLWEKKFSKCYNLIADTCKIYISYDEFLNYYNNNNKKPNNFEFTLSKLNLFPINMSYSNYRRIEFIFKSTNDTTEFIGYYSLIKENNKWKLIWTRNLLYSLYDYNNSGNWKEAIGACYELLNIDPFNGETYNFMAECQLRLKELHEAKESIKKAIEFSPKESSNYHLLALIYGYEESFDLSEKTFYKAIDLTQDKREKILYMSALSLLYQQQKKYVNAKEILIDLLKLDSTYTHAWWQLGNTYEYFYKEDSTIICYQKAISLKPMINHLQQKLLYDLAEKEFKKAIHLTFGTSEQKKLLNEAKNNILKALELNDENTKYKQLLENINDWIRLL